MIAIALGLSGMMIGIVSVILYPDSWTSTVGGATFGAALMLTLLGEDD